MRARAESGMDDSGPAEINCQPVALIFGPLVGEVTQRSRRNDPVAGFEQHFAQAIGDGQRGQYAQRFRVFSRQQRAADHAAQGHGQGQFSQ